MRLSVGYIFPFIVLALSTTAAAATPLLGTAEGFAVLGASTVTNAGATTINGDIGVNPGQSITGTSTVSQTGTTHTADGVALQAQSDALAAYTSLSTLVATATLSGQNLGGLTLAPGVFHFQTTAQLTGTLVLDFAGQANASFVFQVGTSFTTASSAVIQVINGTSGDAIYFAIGSSATLGSGSLLAGNFIAEQSITFQTGANLLCGRAIALNAAVTLSANTISNDCTGAGSYATGRSDFATAGFSGKSVTNGDSGGGTALPIPEPASFPLLAVALAGLAAWRLTHRAPKPSR